MLARIKPFSSVLDSSKTVKALAAMANRMAMAGIVNLIIFVFIILIFKLRSTLFKGFRSCSLLRARSLFKAYLWCLFVLVDGFGFEIGRFQTVNCEPVIDQTDQESVIHYEFTDLVFVDVI